MADIRLYLDGCLVDVDPSNTITETKQINSVFDLSERQTSFTRSFDLLLTNTTSAALNRLGDNYNTSIKPYRRIRADLYRGGTPTITNGNYKVGCVKSRERVTGNIQDGIVGIYDAMADKTFASVNLLELSHSFSAMEITDSFSHTWEDGYIYSILDFGIFETSNVNLRYQNPSLFIKYLWEKIFEHTGFTYSYRGLDDVFNSQEFEDKAITATNGFNYSTIPVTSTNILDLQANEFVNTDDVYNIAAVEGIDTNNIHVVSPLNNQSVIQVDVDGFYEITFDSFLQLTGISNNNTTGGGFFDEGYLALKLNNDLIYVNEGTTDSVTLDLYLTTTDIITFCSQSDFPYNFSFDLSMAYTPASNLVNFSTLLNNMKLKDFFKGVLQMHGLIFQREKGTNNYEFMKIDELIQDRANSQDLTDKFFKLDKECFNFGNFGKTNNLRYKYNNEDDSYNDGSFVIDNENLPTSKTLVTLPFKAIEKTGYNVFGLDVFRAELYDVDRDDTGLITDIKPKDSIPYIFNVNRQNITLGYNFLGVNSSFTGSVPLGNNECVPFDHLIPSHYPNYVNMVNRMHVFDVRLELTSQDVYNFDFLKLVYLKQFQRYFYCNKIQNFRENKVTKVQLIEVNNTRFIS